MRRWVNWDKLRKALALVREEMTTMEVELTNAQNRQQQQRVTTPKIIRLAVIDPVITYKKFQFLAVT